MKPTARSRNSITDGMVLIRPPEPGLNRDEGGERWEWYDDGHAAGPLWWLAGRLTRPAGRAAEGSRTPTTRAATTSRRPRRRRPPPTEGGSDTDELERLAELHADGTLTDEEFAAAKAKILGI